MLCLSEYSLCLSLVVSVGKMTIITTDCDGLVFLLLKIRCHVTVDLTTQLTSLTVQQKVNCYVLCLSRPQPCPPIVFGFALSQCSLSHCRHLCLVQFSLVSLCLCFCVFRFLFLSSLGITHYSLSLCTMSVLSIKPFLRNSCRLSSVWVLPLHTP